MQTDIKYLPYKKKKIKYALNIKLKFSGCYINNLKITTIMSVTNLLSKS